MGVEPATCGLLRKTHDVDSTRPFLGLASPFCMVFGACWDRVSTSGPFTPNYLSWQARPYVKSAGIAKGGASDTFRHIMATLMLEGGAGIRYIQAMLGHVRPGTMQIYTHVSIPMLKQVHTATQPAARLNSEKDQTRECQNDSAQPVDRKIFQDLNKTQSGEPE